MSYIVRTRITQIHTDNPSTLIAINEPINLSLMNNYMDKLMVITCENLDHHASQIRTINFVDCTPARQTESKLSYALAYSYNSYDSCSKTKHRATSFTFYFLHFTLLSMLLTRCGSLRSGGRAPSRHAGSRVHPVRTQSSGRCRPRS